MVWLTGDSLGGSMVWIKRAVAVCALCGIVTWSWAQSEADETAAVATLEGFFQAFSVEHYPNPKIHDWITEDFLIFEMGEAFDWPRFQAFLDSAGYANWVSTDWRFSDLRVSVSPGSAHISYVNEGEFIYPDPADATQMLREQNVWLESVYLVKEGARYKIKFLQSDNVTRTVEPLP